MFWLLLFCPRFHVTHIGKKPASHDPKEESLPDSKQDLGSGDLDHETREGSLNGVVPMDDFPNEGFQEATSDREPQEAYKDESAPGKNLLNVAANLDVAKNGLERKNHSNTGSRQEIDLLGTATSNTCDQKFLCPAERFVSEDLGEMERQAKNAHPSDNEGVQRATNDISRNDRSQGLQGGSSPGLSGKEVNRAQNIEQQVNIIIFFLLIVLKATHFSFFAPHRGLVPVQIAHPVFRCH